MAERRRIIPASVGPDFYGTQEQPDRPTRRLTVTLPESSDKTSPEFSYIDLVKESGGTVEEEKSFNDIDEDDLTGMAALARKFEEKYGVAKGKKKRKRLEDVMDVGLGYDESDPFVDNSECYDELVPSVLTTRFGGFYINSGDLHFKEISGDSDDSDFQVQKRKKKTQKRKKRKALDSDDDKQMKSKKRQLSGSSDTAKKKIKKKLHRQFSSSIEEKKKKKKKLNLPKAPTIAELLKTKKDISSEKPQSTGPPNSNGPGIHNGPDISKVPVSGGGGAHSLENIDPSLDLGMAHLPVDSDMAAILNDTLAGIGDGDDLADVDMLGLQPNGDQEEEEVKMPLDVPSQLDKDVNKIKEAARKSMEGKCKFFTPSVNSLLLDIENQTRSLSCGKRSTIYNHLAYHLPCSKDTLLKRAKKLRLGAQDSQLKEPIIKLKEAISEVMPAQIERYQEECIAAEQAKQERIKEDKNDKNASQDEDEEKSRGPKSQAPRKKFFWTDHLRNLLCHVVSIKLKTYEMSKTRSQSAEDYLKAFLDAEIKDLWPPGWMQTRMLFKESRSVHSPITSMPPKQKKLIPPLKKPSQPKKIEQNPSQATLPASSSKETSPDPQRDHSRNISPYSGDSVSPSRVTTKPPGEGLTILDYAENSNDVENVEKELPQESDGGTLSLLASAMSEVVKKLEKEKTAGLKDSSSRTETEEPKHFSSTASESVDTKDKPDRSLSVSPPDNAHKSGVPPPSLKQLVSPSVLVKKPSSNNKEQGSLHSPPKVSPMHSPTASPLSVDSFSQPTVRLMRQPVLDKISSLHPDSRVIVKTLPPVTDSKTHVSRKESHPPSSGSHLKRSSPNLAGAHSSKVPPVSPLSNYSKTPSPSTSPSGQESIRPQTMYTKHHPLSERAPHQLSSHSPKIPSSALSPNSLQYQVTSASHRVSPSRLSPGMTPNSMSYPASHGGSGFGMSSQQSSLSSVQRPNPVKLSSNIPRRGSFPSMLNQVVSSPLTSPTLTAEDVSHPHSRGFQQISLADLTRKVSSSSHSSASYPRLSLSGMMGRSSSVDQVSPTPESGGMRPSLLPGMGYMPGQNRDPNYDNTSQGQPRLL